MMRDAITRKDERAREEGKNLKEFLVLIVRGATEQPWETGVRFCVGNDNLKRKEAR